jgi:branched-chain amino acid transport system substrate-binding protein
MLGRRLACYARDIGRENLNGNFVKMNRHIKTIAAIGVSIALTTTVWAAERPVIKIGGVLPQQGPLADSFGIPPMQGIELAIAEINAAGGIKGRKLEAVFRDDRTQIQGSVLAFQELSRDPTIAAIFGPALTGAAMAVRPIITENTIPQFSLNYGIGLVKDGFKYYYRMSPALDIGNTAVLAAAQKRLGNGQKLAILASTDAGGTEGSADAAMQAPKFGMTVVADEKFQYGETDFTAQMTRIKASGATVMLAITQGIATNAAIRAARQLGILQKLLIVGVAGLADAQSVELAGNLLNGVVLWDYVCIDDPANPRIAPFVAAYKDKFKSDRVSGAVMNGYDSIKIIAAALEKVVDGDKPIDRVALNDALNKTKYQGFHTLYEFTPEWHNGPQADQVALCIYQDGKRVPYKP